MKIKILNSLKLILIANCPIYIIQTSEFIPYRARCSKILDHVESMAMLDYASLLNNMIKHLTKISDS